MKVRLTITAVKEYELNPKHYPEGATPQQMLDIDIEGARLDPYLTLDDERTQWEFKGEMELPHQP